MSMFIHFFCLCLAGLTIELNFNTLKVAYSPSEMCLHGIMVVKFIKTNIQSVDEENYDDSLQANLIEVMAH